MKKLIVIALAVVMALSVVAFAACNAGETVEGEYSYAHPYGGEGTYGCKVKVTVNEGVITKIVVEADTADFFNLSAANEEQGWTEENRQAWIKGQPDLITSLVGQKVEDINKIQVACNEKGVPDAGGITGAPSAVKLVAGATQSTGRLILAVQDALSHLAPEVQK